MAASVDDYRALDWQQLITTAQTRTCRDLHGRLSEWLRDASVTGRTAEVWREVEPILSLGFHLNDDDAPPFYPRETYEQLDAEVVMNIAAMVAEVRCDDLEARVRDIAWTRRFGGYDQVAPAVDAYVRTATNDLDPARWTFPYNRMKRAIELGSSIGQNSEPFEHAVAAIEQVLDAHGTTDPLWFAQRLMLLLLRFRVSSAARYADLAHAIATSARTKYESEGVGNGLECNREQGYLDLEISLRGTTITPDQRRALEVEVAEACVRQAEGVIVAAWPNSQLVATHFVEQAIARLRKTGNSAPRIEQLRVRLQELQREAVSGFKAIPLQLNVAEDRQRARAAVAGLTPLDALFGLAAIYEPLPKAAQEAQLRESLAEMPSRVLIPQSFLGPRGTTLATHAGVREQTESTGFDLEMLRDAGQQQSYVASIFLQPAAEQIRIEHRLDAQWFLGLVHGSTFVPLGRELSFARGLSAGLDGDVDGAAVFLIPQFEHSVRELFADRGVPVATLTSAGTQNELNMGQLLEHPRAIEILGETNVFDLRALLTEKAGSNLRNDIAHGLIADGARHDAKTYFWWVCLRFCLMPMRSRWGGTPT